MRVLIFLLLISSALHAQKPETSFKIPGSTEQVIVVTSASWTATTGNLQRYEIKDGAWIKTGTSIPVALGKTGLTWGRGLHKNSSTEKKEGDGKAPAGVFALGTMFGYAESSPSANGFPYKQSTDRDYFIDDDKSSDYNTWVTIPPGKPNYPKERWFSYEKMKRADHLYEYGVVILHNSSPVEKGKGSAIFFHVWRNPGSPTLGCTAMSKENMLTLVKWLDEKKKPLLIQVPESELMKVN